MLDIVVDAAKQAGEILMHHYGRVKTEFKVDDKGAASIVTQADLDSEAKIVEILKEHFPSFNIHSEEQVQEDNHSEYTWYIDPLDGTSNFTRNIPLFGVSIGLVKGTTPVLGVLYFPVLNLLVQAEQGQGAFANGQKLTVSKRELKHSLYYSGGYHNGHLQLEPKVAECVGLMKIIDASSYEFAQIAMGDAELYILNSVPHDVVAGIVIVQEAGGQVTDAQGAQWTPSSKTIVASNQVIHTDVLRLMADKS